METWHVYQLRSDTELLYVGYTRRLEFRLSQHRRQKAWWPEVTAVQSEVFATEDEARQREKALWAGGRPKYNQRNPFQTEEERRRRRRELKRARSTPESRATEAARARERGRTPEGREAQRQRNRTFSARRSRQVYYERTKNGLRGRWQQSGPGLF